MSWARHGVGEVRPTVERGSYEGDEDQTSRGGGQASQRGLSSRQGKKKERKIPRYGTKTVACRRVTAQLYTGTDTVCHSHFYSVSHSLSHSHHGTLTQHHGTTLERIERSIPVLAFPGTAPASAPMAHANYPWPAQWHRRPLVQGTCSQHFVGEKGVRASIAGPGPGPRGTRPSIRVEYLWIHLSRAACVPCCITPPVVACILEYRCSYYRGIELEMVTLTVASASLSLSLSGSHSQALTRKLTNSFISHSFNPSQCNSSLRAQSITPPISTHS